MISRGRTRDISAFDINRYILISFAPRIDRHLSAEHSCKVHRLIHVITVRESQSHE